MTRAPLPVMPRPAHKALDADRDPVRALASALGFLPGGDVASEAERVIAEHLELAREEERRRLAAALQARADRAEDYASSARADGVRDSTVAALEASAVTWQRAVRSIRPAP